MYSRKLYLFDRCIRSKLSLLIIILHRELWEGLKIITLIIIWFFGIPDLIYFTYFNSSHSNVPSKKLKLTIKTYRKECIRGLHTNNQGPFI